MKFDNCEFGGGTSCTRQGGDGFTKHREGYSHKFMPAGKLLSKGTDSVYSVPLLDNTFLSDDLLNKSLFTESIQKSLYHFDLETPTGVSTFLELLPVLSDDIIKEVYTEIWPGYPTDESSIFNIRMAKHEVRGYLLDYMKQHDFEEPTEERPREIDASI